MSVRKVEILGAVHADVARRLAATGVGEGAGVALEPEVRFVGRFREPS